MRIAIVGSRTVQDKEYVFNTIDRFISTVDQPVLLSGGASGVDSLVAEYAKERGLDFFLFKPYHMLDNSVGFQPKYFFVRNRQIVNNADGVLAIWDGESKGTAHTIKYAEKKNIPVHTVILEDGK